MVHHNLYSAPLLLGRVFCEDRQTNGCRHCSNDVAEHLGRWSAYPHFYAAATVATGISKASPSIQFNAKLYGAADEDEVVAAIVAASNPEPDRQELRSCIRATFKTRGERGSVHLHRPAAQGMFDWHISKGRPVTKGQKTTKTCSLFGVDGPTPGTLTLTAVGRHGRGSTFYKLDHWRDRSVTISTFTF